MPYWLFDENRCTFEPSDMPMAQDSDLPIVFNNGEDVFVRVAAKEQRWPSGEQLVVAGVEFDRELFE